MEITIAVWGVAASQVFAVLLDASTVACFVMHQGPESTVVCVAMDAVAGARRTPERRTTGGVPPKPPPTFLLSVPSNVPGLRFIVPRRRGVLAAAAAGILKFRQVLSHWRKVLVGRCGVLQQFRRCGVTVCLQLPRRQRFPNLSLLTPHGSSSMVSARGAERRFSQLSAVNLRPRSTQSKVPAMGPVPGQSVDRLEDLCRVVCALGKFPKLTLKNRHRTRGSLDVWSYKKIIGLGWRSESSKQHRCYPIAPTRVHLKAHR